MSTDQLATFEERVKEKLMDSIAGLLPEEQVDKLVEEQHKHFIQHKLPALIESELKKIYSQMLSGILTSSESYSYINNQLEASEPVKEIITKAAPEIFQNMFGGMLNMAIADFRNQLSNRSY